MDIIGREPRFLDQFPNEINSRIVSYLPNDCVAAIPFNRESADYLYPLLDSLQQNHVKQQDLPSLMVKYKSHFPINGIPPTILDYTPKAELGNKLRQLAPMALLDAFGRFRNITATSYDLDCLKSDITQIVEAIPESLSTPVTESITDHQIVRICPLVFASITYRVPLDFIESLFAFQQAGNEEARTNWNQHQSRVAIFRRDKITHLFNRHIELMEARQKILQSQQEALENSCGTVNPRKRAAPQTGSSTGPASKLSKTDSCAVQ
jgi:hypothetical protein